MTLRHYPAKKTSVRKHIALAVVVALALTANWALASSQTSSNTGKLKNVNKSSKHHFVDPELRQLLKQTISKADSFADRFDAEVWLVAKSNRLTKFIKNPQARLRLLKAVHRYASQHKLPPELVLAVIETESHFDRFAISRAGAQGMMQIMPFWKKEIGRSNDNLTKLDINLQYGCTILAHYYKKSSNNWAEALARYNGSYGSTRYSNKVIIAWDKWR